MRAALIGLGMVADMHVSALAASRNRVSLAGVMARDPDKSRLFADRHGISRTYASVSDIVRDRPDFVILATPPDARIDFARAFAAAGIPLLTEKPLERTLAQAKELVSEYQAVALPLGVALQHRMRPAARTLKDLVETGQLGRIASVELRVPWWRPQSYYDSPGRGTYDRDGGGVLITQAIHQIDLMLQVCGPVANVAAMVATTKLHELEAEDFAGATFTFASGAIGTLMASVTHFPGGAEELIVNGTAGSARLNAAQLEIHRHGAEPQILGTHGAGTGGGADPMAFSSDWHQAIIEDFAEAIATKRAPLVDGHSALAAHALIDAIQTASRTGRVTVPEMIDG